MIRATIWNENIADKSSKRVLECNPGGIHNHLASFLADDEVKVRTATLDEPENGLPEAVLAETDVLLWWGHSGHHWVTDEVATRVHDHVLRGMGFIGLHSAHLAKPFTRLMGTSCTLQWRDHDFERVYNLLPGHPIARGIPDCFELEDEEMYGERFDIPEPQELVFIGWFSGGEVFRSGCTWQRGNGRVFYFQPGHESYPIYHMPEVQKILVNAVRWAAPAQIFPPADSPCAKVTPEERLKK